MLFYFSHKFLLFCLTVINSSSLKKCFVSVQSSQGINSCQYISPIYEKIIIHISLPITFCPFCFYSRGVKSIHWSDGLSQGLCYMCVVHEKNISIWKVEGRQPKLAFKQIRKVNIQPIAQGNITQSQVISGKRCPILFVT